MKFRTPIVMALLTISFCQKGMAGGGYDYMEDEYNDNHRPAHYNNSNSNRYKERDEKRKFITNNIFRTKNKYNPHYHLRNILKTINNYNNSFNSFETKNTNNYISNTSNYFLRKSNDTYNNTINNISYSYANYFETTKVHKKRHKKRRSFFKLRIF